MGVLIYVPLGAKRAVCAIFASTQTGMVAGAFVPAIKGARFWPSSFGPVFGGVGKVGTAPSLTTQSQRACSARPSTQETDC